MKKDEQYSAEYKATVALAALRSELPLLELAEKYRVHPTLVKLWERQAREGLQAVFLSEEVTLAPKKGAWNTKRSSKDSRLSSEERYYFSYERDYEYRAGKRGASNRSA